MKITMHHRNLSADGKTFTPTTDYNECYAIEIDGVPIATDLIHEAALDHEVALAWRAKVLASEIGGSHGRQEQ